MQVGESAVRSAGALLQVGDTVQISWSAGPANLTLVGLLLALSEIEQTAVQQYNGGTSPGDFVGYYYANGNSKTGTVNSLTWSADLGPSFMPYPQDDCEMISACAAFKPSVGSLASGWTPAVGTLLAEHQSADGKIALAAHVASAASLISIEPGGSWSSGSASILTANYQFGTAPVVATPATHFDNFF